ncbi:MAG: hypothetical protein N5P05_002612 [Chroococcopsis gigantea SAG 12.99]|jgi:cupin 2 domain-containing protein|nr:cupin domain-containing protein [Chlorogloea purpurea SAG 13.99]MDV3001006.1 hypothetical protein [Chroococcopsis gigantea SAG 12.99]
MNNIFALSTELPQEEVFEAILTGSNIFLKRIISTGQVTPPGEWYDQIEDEWVLLLQGDACLSFEDGSSIDLKAGDYLLIPAGRKHRVERTSSEPPCIWLALHGNLLNSE